MAIQKSSALVLKNFKLGETSKIVTLYTRQFGLEKVVAKGARGLKSRYWGNLESLNYIQAIFYLKPGRDLHILSDADIVNSFPEIRKNLTKTSYAYAVGEMLARTQWQGARNERLFDMTIETLKAINNTLNSPKTLFLGFQSKFFNVTGVNPDTHSCLSCGRQIKNEPVTFDPHAGRIICHQCQPKTGRLDLSARALRFFNWLKQEPPATISQHVIPEPLLNEIGVIFDIYMNYHFEGLQLKSLDFLNTLKETLAPETQSNSSNIKHDLK